MTIRVQSFSRGLEPAVRAFNNRLKAAGCSYQFPVVSESQWLPRSDNEPVYEEYFLATENDVVRGGYILKHQPFAVAGAMESVSCLYLPLSEGAVNPTYSKLGLQLLTSAMRKQPLLFSLGMGSMSLPYPRMLQAAGWTMWPVPFYFNVLRADRFLANIVHLRRRPFLRPILDALAVSGVGPLVLKLARGSSILARHRSRARAPEGTIVAEFPCSCDAIWREWVALSSFAASRDSRSLNRLYPASRDRYIRVTVTEGREFMGWAVLLDSKMSAHRQFGEMRVGTIVDCLALPHHEVGVVEVATSILKERGVDLIVSSQAHTEWRRALASHGYLRGPSNYIFAASRQLAARLAPFQRNRHLMHIVRGDGEGPTHL